MGQSATVRLSGVLSSQAAPVSSFSTSFNEIMPLEVCATYQASASGVIHVTGTSGTPGPLALQGIVKVRAFALRLLSGATVEVRITSGAGVAALKISDKLFIHSPNPGDEITAIAFVTVPAGVDLQYLIAGDES